MNYFSEDFIEKVRQASDIVTFISEDTVLKGRGDNYMGLCPFPDHTEKTPSFSASASKQVYHCFGCQRSGNIFTYLKEMRGWGFVETVTYLARKAHIPIPREGQFQKSLYKTTQLFSLNEKACKFYQQKLNECSPDHKVWKYLKKRGYTLETIKAFRLGYAPRGNALLELYKKSEDQKQALHLGLLAQNQQKQMYDNFRNRLIFPIFSPQQQVIGFGARALDDSLPKYINSKESDIFHKGKSFYGLNESARHLRQKRSVLVVEGYTDFLSLWQEGFQNIVATLGTALTQDHAQLLKRYVDSVTVVFDGDEAGVKASERSLPLLLSESLQVKSLPLPEKQDPDDFIKKQGRESFATLLKNSQDLFFQVLKNKTEQLQSEGRDLFYILEEILPFLKATQKEELFVIYKQRVLDYFGQDKQPMEKVLDQKLKFAKTHASDAAKSPVQEKKIDFSKALSAEKLLLVLCLERESFLQAFLKEKGESLLRTAEIKQIFTKIKEKYGQKSLFFDNIPHLVMNLVTESHKLFKDSHPALMGLNQEGLEKVFSDSLSFLKKKQISAKVNKLISEIKMGSNQEEMKQLEEIYQLSKERLR